MSRYILRRLLVALPVVAGILLLTFLIQAVIPTDAVSAMYEGQVTEDEAAEAMAAMRERYGLDQPWYVQFVRYSANVLQGDFGESIRLRRPVSEEIGYRFLNTLQLTGAALLIGIGIGVPMGILSAAKKDTWLDVGAMTVGLLGISMPAFFFGLLLILVFAVWLMWIPVVPRGGAALLLPALTLGLIEAAPLSRIARSAMIEILRRDHIRAARARGMGEFSVIMRHALPGTLLAVMTVIGLQFGNLLGGAFIIEVIFGWRGIGELGVKAIQWRDFALTQAIILISAGAHIVANLVVDILYAWVDPRVDYNS
ncbi:putative glutathione ABC transporter, permease protein GsiC [Acetobacteraceae bacterium AT-5844]|nr:putative glutathione ABC transporter, permease protein GsiC [Acetobacteraceae bacterium AT-5844]